MSRVGNKIIIVPEGVKVEIAEDNTVTVTGAKGTLVRQFSPSIKIEMDGNEIKVCRTSEQKAVKQLHGTTRALLANMIEGVHNGYEKNLEIVGIGYRAQMQGKKLALSVGLSHPVEFEATDDLAITVDGNTNIKIEGIDKEAVGALASNIRKVRPPEPYKGKGIRYVGEYVIRKEGKTGKGK